MRKSDKNDGWIVGILVALAGVASLATYLGVIALVVFVVVKVLQGTGVL